MAMKIGTPREAIAFLVGALVGCAAQKVAAMVLEGIRNGTA